MPDFTIAPEARHPGARPGPGGMRWPGCLGAALVLACGASAAAAQETREARFVSADGAEVGRATLAATDRGVLITLDLQGLPPGGWHGFHLHENGVCDAGGGFQSAGDHFAEAGTEHGYLAEGGHHAGDMPNQHVAADGTLVAEIHNPFLYLGGPNDNVTGRALILHAEPDDYRSQPAGDAGDRLACAVVE